MKTIVTNTIMNYRDSYLNDFAVTFRHSKLAKSSDEADISIVSSLLDITLYKKVDITPGVSQNIVLKYNCELMNNVPLKENTYPANDIHTFFSSPFRYGGQICIFEDNGEGKVRLVRTDGITNQVIANIGSVDYETGTVLLNGITVDTFLGSAVKFYVRPRDLDIKTQNNTILDIERDNIVVSVEQLRE